MGTSTVPRAHEYLLSCKMVLVGGNFSKEIDPDHEFWLILPYSLFFQADPLTNSDESENDATP